ncbi:hypothetical protein BDW62DRAFT_197258 [Aspergillus aurantiobrunneus]
MADPFFVRAGVVGVVSLGLTLCQGLITYYGPWNGYDNEIADFSTKVEGLMSTSKVLEGFVSEDQELDLPSDQYRKLKRDWLRLRRALYPFKRETLVTLSQMVSGLQENLTLSLQLPNGFFGVFGVSQPALISQQQMQIRNLLSKTTTIDVRTTRILDVVQQ